MISPMQVWIPSRAIMPNSWRNPYKSCQDCGFLRLHLLKSCQSLSQLILAWIYHPRCHSLKGPGWLFPQLLHTWRIAKCESSVVADGQQIWVWGLKGRANVPEMGSGQRVPLECNSFHAVPINQYIEDFAKCSQASKHQAATASQGYSIIWCRVSLETKHHGRVSGVVVVVVVVVVVGSPTCWSEGQSSSPVQDGEPVQLPRSGDGWIRQLKAQSYALAICSPSLKLKHSMFLHVWTILDLFWVALCSCESVTPTGS